MKWIVFSIIAVSFGFGCRSSKIAIPSYNRTFNQNCPSHYLPLMQWTKENGIPNIKNLKLYAYNFVTPASASGRTPQTSCMIGLHRTVFLQLFGTPLKSRKVDGLRFETWFSDITLHQDNLGNVGGYEHHLDLMFDLQSDTLIQYSYSLVGQPDGLKKVRQLPERKKRLATPAK